MFSLIELRARLIKQKAWLAKGKFRFCLCDPKIFAFIAILRKLLFVKEWFIQNKLYL